MTLAQININTNKKCKRCKQKGACENGYCLKCITKMIEEGKFDYLFDKIKKQEPPK